MEKNTNTLTDTHTQMNNLNVEHLLTQQGKEN